MTRKKAADKVLSSMKRVSKKAFMCHFVVVPLRRCLMLLPQALQGSNHSRQEHDNRETTLMETFIVRFTFN
jgi:hypothetical protein